MGSQLKIVISMRLAVGICLTVAIGVLLSVADAEPEAKPLTVKAHIRVDVNSGESQSSGRSNKCAREMTGSCLEEDETGCKLPCGLQCCESLECYSHDDSDGICGPPVLNT